MKGNASSLATEETYGRSFNEVGLILLPSTQIPNEMAWITFRFIYTLPASLTLPNDSDSLLKQLWVGNCIPQRRASGEAWTVD